MIARIFSVVAFIGIIGVSGCLGPKEPARGFKGVARASRAAGPTRGGPLRAVAPRQTVAATAPTHVQSPTPPAAEPSDAAAVAPDGTGCGGLPGDEPAGPADAASPRVDLVIAPLAEPSQGDDAEAAPAVLKPSVRGLCMVAIRAAGPLRDDQALLYSFFTPGAPDPLTALSPGLLDRGFDLTKLGIFSGGRGAVSGMTKFSGEVPDRVVLYIPQGLRLRGNVEVRAQLWQMCDGRWKPHDEVREQTIFLK